ncbi:hypothetical protein ATE84_3141 [Aquimarina sp. MAR_2010_214]|uniref:hypothetical protein n=1 Tax=Aquimarina sp. MAR_2010_214 TaxID=1250026 RepID=UPI000C70633E|nr:hypothetical protein [Aquimarina sp. MAR_2010_214]PKV51072.1 hypothetical protein ATE84_3141 [Aquimarina sp. MAR_2010_214]
MNKLSALKNLFVFIISISIFSCGSDDSESNIPNDDSILADYIANIGSIKDFSINANNEIYYIHTGNSDGGVNLSIRKMSNTGDITVLDELDFSLFGNEMGITNSGDENIYYVTDSHNEGNKVHIYSVNSSSSSTYSMTPISSPFVGPIRMSAIENFGDETYITFDYSALGLRRYFPNLETDMIIAGSGDSSITDGTGLNASFKFVTKILSTNEIIYVIDDSNNLRKIEKTGNEFNVTTVISDYTNSFNDIAVDKNGNILVLVDNKGIYKLNISNNSLEEYLTGEIKLKDSNNGSYGTEWGGVDKFLIKKNDIFLYSSQKFIKISDFETKI